MVKKFLGNCLSFPFKRRSWTSERRIIEWLKKSLILLWIVYFILELEPDKNIFRVISKEIVSRVEQVVKFPFKEIYKNYSLTFLLSITFICVLINSILFLYKKHCRYKSLDEEEFPEYDFDFQENLVVFLNAKSRFGHNIYWLDGAWGSGKTHFLRTFFEHQAFKKLEIYYVSCFGITSREQAERALIAEIEDRSSFGSLDYVPVAGSLIKWGFKTLGLNLMKKDSVVIFDDLERAVYVDAEDKPQDYNDLLGFIDYLANHKNQKVIVVYNAQELQQTQLAIIDGKFKPLVNRLSSYSERQISEMIEAYPFDKDKEYLRKFYSDVFKLVWRNYDHFNLRLLTKFLTLSSQNDLSAIVRQVIETNLLNFPERVEDDEDDYARFMPVRYRLLLLEMVQKVERVEDTNLYKIYYKGTVNHLFLGDECLHYGNLYEIVAQHKQHLYERESSFRTETALLRLYYGEGNQGVEYLPLSISNLIFMFNFLHPGQVLNKVSLGEHMKNHFKVVAVPPAPDPTVVHKLTDDFQTVFQSFRHKNALHQVKHLEAWQAVLLELKTELESGLYYNLFNFPILDWSLEKNAHLYNMPQGLFEEWDKRNNRLNS